MQGLVAGRQCGGCTVCCEAPTIDTAQLKKLPGVLCPHCTRSGGCGIYDTRPDVCRDFHCGWRSLAALDEAWRPDRCGILIQATRENIPPEYPRNGLTFTLVGSYQAIAWPPFVAAVAWHVEAGIPVFLGVPGEAGQSTRHVFLNPGLAGAVASRNLSVVATQLANALAAGIRAPKEQILLRA